MYFADPCFFHRIDVDTFFFSLVHVDQYACAYLLDLDHFDTWLNHFRGDPDIDASLDVKVLDDSTILLQM